MPNKYFGLSLLLENAKSEQHHWILRIWISLGAKFQRQLTILIFWTKLAQKVYFRSKKKSEDHHWILYIRISLGTKF